jgi:hypothetical protein
VSQTLVQSVREINVFSNAALALCEFTPLWSAAYMFRPHVRQANHLRSPLYFRVYSPQLNPVRSLDQDLQANRQISLVDRHHVNHLSNHQQSPHRSPPCSHPYSRQVVRQINRAGSLRASRLPDQAHSLPFSQLHNPRQVPVASLPVSPVRSQARGLPRNPSLHQHPSLQGSLLFSQQCSQRVSLPVSLAVNRLHSPPSSRQCSHRNSP